MNRRGLLGWLGAGAAMLVAPVGGFAAYVYADSDRGNSGTLTFRNRLRVPPQLPPLIEEDGRKRFRLTLQAGVSELLPGTRTGTWGVNGPLLGPTIRANPGDRVAVDVTNRLGVATSIHWHGMHLPAEMDGGPHRPIEPGTTWRPHWTVEQPAATLWYHPHLHRSTAEHVYRGIAGLFLIDDQQQTPLPRSYGVDDVPLILQDRSFTAAGELSLDGLTFGGLTITGQLGDHVLINGVHDPFFEVTTTLVRFRLVNGSNARIWNLGFSDGREFRLIATDGGLCEHPVTLDRLPLSPGERAEIVVAFRPGDQVILRSTDPVLGANVVYERLAGGSDDFDLLKIVAGARLTTSPELPQKLADLPAPIPPTATYPLVMGDFLLNGHTMDPGRADRMVRPGSTELWVIDNGQAIPHNFHVHGASFRVLDVDGRPPAPHLRGEKDTVYTAPGTTTRLAVRFLDHDDPARPYMYHCHLLAHEDAGMMGQFLTTVHPAALHGGHGIR